MTTSPTSPGPNVVNQVAAMSDYATFLATKARAMHGPLALDCGPSVEEFDSEQGTTRGWHYVYGLHDPRTGQLRYVGKSDNPRGRLTEHMREVRNTHRCNWVQSLKSVGLKPILTIIDATPPGSDWAWMERVYIASGRRAGLPLTNIADGGEGTRGIPAETLRRMAEARRGTKQSEETKAKRSAALKGRSFHTDLWRRRIREAAAARVATREQRDGCRDRMQKLADDQVREIRRRVTAGERRALLAEEFGVNTGTISNVVTRRTYGHVSDGAG